MAPRTSLISSISDYVDATSATLAGRQAMARWSVTRPALRRFPTLSHVVTAARGGPAEQDHLLGELLAVAGDDPLAQLAVVAALSRKLSAAVAAWRRGGASAQDLAELEADLVSAAWAEVVACAAAVNAGGEGPPRLGLALVDRARQSVRVCRRRELRQAARRVSTEGLPEVAAGEDRPTAELLADEIASGEGRAPARGLRSRVLSIGKLTPGRADYYVEQVHAGADEYYVADQAEPGYWVGKATSRLGLEGQVDAQAFRRVLDACHPGTGEPLGVDTGSPNRVAGFDLCFSSPKSISVAWALAPPELAEAIAAAHDRAVAEALGAMEDEALRARRGAGGRDVIGTEGFVGAAFPHRSSRGGDPQLHTHVVVANAVPAEDGRWSTPYGGRLYAWAKTTGYLYQAALRHELAALGFGFGPLTKGSAELAGVPKELSAEFSSRRADIEAVLERSGASSRGAAEVAALSTRGPKSAVPGLTELRGQWHDRAGALGIGPGFVEGLAQRELVAAPDAGPLADELIGPEGLTANATGFDRRAVLQALAVAHPGGAAVADLRSQADSLLASPEVVPLSVPVHAERRYSTAELVSVEAALLERAARQTGAGLSVVGQEHLEAALAKRPSLSDEQKQMVSTLTTSGAGVQVVVGRAGAGKTFALDAAREAMLCLMRAQARTL